MHHHVVDGAAVQRTNNNPWIAEPTTEFWSVFRYGDCVHILQNPHIFSSREGPGPERIRAVTDDGMLVFADEPAHRWQRGIANKAFTPRRVAGIEPKIQQVADELVDGFHARGECDLVEEFAAPMTIRTIAKIVGVDDGRVGDFYRWGVDTIGAFGASKQEDIERSAVSAMEFHAYYIEIINDRRAALAKGADVPDDILTAMITAESEGKKLNDAELFMGAQQFLSAGFATTMTGIATGIWLLHHHPEQRRQVEADPGLYPVLVEEVLRYYSPSEGLCRTTTQDTEIGGVRIPKGAKVRWMPASANRDPRKFDRAGEFTLDRDVAQLRKHLTFGHGIHMCIGAALSRAELRIAYETLLRRLPGLRLDDEEEPTPSYMLMINGFDRLPVRWDP